MVHRTRTSGLASVSGHRRPVLGAALLLFAGLALGPTGVAEEATSNEDSQAPEAPQTTFLETVSVTSTRTEKTLAETPGQVDVVSQETISELGYTQLGDLLRYAPGVFVDGDPTRLGSSGFNIRGIGGNRVLTQIDGIPTAEQFQFGPFTVPQYAIDLEALERVEIVRSAGSALYGSDALGGVVSLVTRSPSGYLKGSDQVTRARVGFEGRSDESSGTLVHARGNDRWQGSLVFTHRDGEELDNQGDVGSEDSGRTEPNPIDRRQDNLLLKLGHSGDNGSQLVLTLEGYDTRTLTEVFSSRAPASPFGSAVLDFDAVDTQERVRLSAEQSLVTGSSLSDSLIWRAYFQGTRTDQVAKEERLPAVGLAQRVGLVAFEQDTFGLEAESRKPFGSAHLLTYGASLRRDQFDQLRDRTELVVGTGVPVPTSLIFPTKYFPESDVDEAGVFLQAELDFLDGKLKLIPGLRYDRYDLDANENDRIFLEGNPGTAEPADLTSDAFSPKLGVIVALNDELSVFGQLSGGFRAPPMSAVNNGFTNQAGGYRTLANPELDAETSENFEIGFRGSYSRGSFSITAYENHYDDFIETVTLGFDPVDFLIEFQPRNLTEVEISGIEIAGDVRLGRQLLLRAAFSSTDGDDISTGEPLDSIVPATFVTGLRYVSPRGRWGIEGTATFADSKDADDLPSDSTQFQTPSYEVLDVGAWIELSNVLTLQVSAWNLTDETYWSWGNVRGQSQTSTAIDRYTSPGRSFGLQLRAQF